MQPCPVFSGDAGILTQVFMLGQQALLSTEPTSQPQIFSEQPSLVACLGRVPFFVIIVLALQFAHPLATDNHITPSDGKRAACPLTP